jgi:hypothetical protein
VRSLRFGHWSRATLAFGIGSLGCVQVAAAQIGISSGIAQIVLVAHVPARADIREVRPARHGQAGSLQETSVGLRFAANGGYRLLVKATDRGAGSRVWVRAVDGRFRELVPGAAIVVAQSPAGTEELEPKVQYRVEGKGTSSSEPVPPVRYEIVVNPTL